MRIKTREMRIGGERHVALGLDSDYLPIYRILGTGLAATRMLWWSSVLHGVSPDSIGDEVELEPAEIAARYGPLLNREPTPTHPHADRSVRLPLLGVGEAPAVG